MSEKLTILFTTMDSVGHVNACIGLAEALQSRGHKIVFVAGKPYEGKLSQYGFTEEILKTDDTDEQKKMKPGEHRAQKVLSSGLMSGVSPFEKMKLLKKDGFMGQMIDKTITEEPIMRQIIAKHEPNVLIIDHKVGLPSIIYNNKPWISICSGNPIFYIEDDRTPPPGSGLPSDYDRKSKESIDFREFGAQFLAEQRIKYNKYLSENGFPIKSFLNFTQKTIIFLGLPSDYDRKDKEWTEFRVMRKKLFAKQNVKYNQYLLENGFPTIGDNRCLPDSPFLNIYGYPEELDYTDIRPLPDKWMRVDAFMRRSEPGYFEIPDKLKNRDEKTQKLVYLSLGSMGSINIQLMKRLVNILSKSPHKYIVSKGLLGDKYELPDNMWGQNSVPQTKVLPLVDLVITHGGNNTVTETFSFGKPMIVMPLFGDQYDNAQRVHEKRFGIRLEPYNCTEEELLGAVEKLLNDQDLIQRLNVASKRMLSSDSIQKVSEVIERIAKDFQKN